MSKSATLLIRRDTKQSWSGASKQIMLDGFERLAGWAQNMNDMLGWRKYAVESPEGAAVQTVDV